ncbi:uncharacterized protein C8Q71DRAFT_99456 [Rhodofomes roseus]|uniref:Uncharacterized protein n=1 Tax=Rhodofomes roseus TaxID=34475 RepID=A0ABQ8KF95_9APHY|nr:uncharacterized protein C8Q71DRAFT_99456 [Rhodofomes roseus]KAH9835845.1 hypothetical protein C8Q71DRAFT_99456 [Rhodofomes roseus]
MDELIQHCLRELSYDGDLGCDVARLRDFIERFYARRGTTFGQKIDDAYCAFIWAVLVQQPNVRVGVVPEGAGTEVYIAPQKSAKRKAKAKGEEVVEAPPAVLQVVQDAGAQPLDALRREYGDKLRVAVDPDTIFKALTGSHIRDSKLSPMVYTALQLISRGREAGITSVDLARKSGYDPKTCHYLINQLLSLNLVVKRKKTHVSTSTLVHRDLFERDAIWQSIVDEEKQAREVPKQRVAEEGSDEEEDQDESEFSGGPTVQFDPIDERHLSSLELMRGRIVKLLQNSPGLMHASKNLLLKLGFANPTKANRRQFTARCLNELIRQGVIEKVRVRGKNQKLVTCIHLLDVNDSVARQSQDILPHEEGTTDETEGGDALIMNLTLHRQIIDLLDKSGEKGLTLGDLCNALGNFDRRTVELFLERLHTNSPPPHLADLGIAHNFEYDRRERHYKYWTVAHFRFMAIKEDIPLHPYDVDLATTGGFMDVNESQFFEDEAGHNAYVDGLRLGHLAKASGASKAKRPHKNPVLPDGTIKRGRPRKSAAVPGVEPASSAKMAGVRGKKRKRGDDVDEGAGTVVTNDSEPPSKRKRGRPPKRQQHATAQASSVPAASSADVTIAASKSTSPPVLQEQSGVTRGGRRSNRKQTDSTTAEPALGTHADKSIPALPVPRKRGRPRKQPLPDADSTAAAAAASGTTEDAPSRKDCSPGSSRENVEPPPTLEFPTATNVVEVCAHQHQHEDFVAEGTDSARAPLMAGPSASHDIDVVPPLNVDDRAPCVAVPREDEPQSPLRPGLTVVEASSGVEMPSNPPTPTDTNALPDSTSIQFHIPIDPTLLNEGNTSATSHTGSAAKTVTDAAEPTTSSPEPGNTGAKRAQSETAVQAPLAKRLKSSGGTDGANRDARSKTTLIQARRERELLRVVKDAGGMINISSKDFYDAHAALVEKVTSAGEATSTRIGSRMDKRTVEATMKDLDARGKIRLITTSVKVSTGTTRPIRIAYLPEIPDAELHTFLSGISIQQFPPAAPIKTLEEPVVYGGARHQIARGSSVANDSVQDDVTPTGRKGAHSSSDPLLDAVLNDKNTIAQSHGFIVGRLARARALHLWTTDFLQSETSSVNIVSARERIVAFSFFLNDLPISTYCAVVSSQVQSDELAKLLRSPEGALTPIGQLSPTIRDPLQIGRWRARDRLLGVLEILCRLKVMDPLLSSHSAIPAITVDSTANHPPSFDVAPVETWTPVTAPGYFRLNASAAVHIWALSEDSPPFWKGMSVHSVADSNEYWRQLRIAAQDKAAAKQVPAEELGEPLTGASELGRVLRRPSSWTDSYALSPNQEAFLKQHVELASGDTPLQGRDGDRLDRLCTAISAPKDAVVRFYESLHNKILNEKEKMVRKAERRAEESKARDAQSKAMIAQRAAQAKAQRERDWDDMVAQVHPAPLTDLAAARVRRLRTRFLQSSGKNHEKWESEIAQAIQESIFAADKVLSANKVLLARPVVAPAPPPPVVATAPEKSVRELIASQGPPLAPRQPVRKSKRGKEAKDGDAPASPARRHRFQWNREYDELARDASAIIRARCRGHHRIDLAALSQAFPAVPKNSVRQRIVHFRESPGADTYLQRLEDKWYDIWMQHRGTEVLPDEDPESPSNFDMIAHLEFLRKHVDKNALRVGFVELSRDATFALPCDVEHLTSLWEIQEKPIASPLFDFVWSGSAEEGREKQLALHAFTTDLREMPRVVEYSSDNLFVADTAMKMVLGTPNELYDIQAATGMLHSVGEDAVKAATETMLARGVLSKVVRDPSKSRPGRTLKISDSNQNAIGGSMPQDVFQDAAALEDVLGQDEDPDAWREWSLLSSDGDMAALLDLVSINKINFKVDTSSPQARRPAFDWNSKKADDDDIETGIMVRLSNRTEDTKTTTAVEAIAEPTEVAISPMQQIAFEIPIDPVLSDGVSVDVSPSEPSPVTQHGKTWDGSAAFCQKDTTGLVDCQACLQASKSKLLLTVGDEESEIVNDVLDELQDAVAEGLEKDHIMGIVKRGRVQSALAVLTRITHSDTPLAYWTGYTSMVLVATEHIRPWAVCISQGADGKAMIHPRRWLDIAGRKIVDVWEAALRAIAGVILFRPGVTQAEIRWRLRSVYDRQEVNDVLRYLKDQGHIERRVDAHVGQSIEVGEPDNEEEQHVFWFISGEKHWYEL